MRVLLPSCCIRRTFSNSVLDVNTDTYTSHQKVLALYRRLLRAQQVWPKDPLRPARNIKEMLALKIREEFRRCMGEKDPIMIQKCLDDGNRQLKSLIILLNNTYALRYPRDAALMDKIRPSAELCSLLSTESQEKLMRETPNRMLPWISRLINAIKRRTRKNSV
jgi:hypothetical protein